LLKHATNHTQNRCKQAETSHTNSTFGFLPTHKPALKKPKELFLANARITIALNTENRK